MVFGCLSFSRLRHGSQRNRSQCCFVLTGVWKNVPLYHNFQGTNGGGDASPTQLLTSYSGYHWHSQCRLRPCMMWKEHCALQSKSLGLHNAISHRYDYGPMQSAKPHVPTSAPVRATPWASFLAYDRWPNK